MPRPTAGFTSGLESIINLVAGVPPGVVPGRWDNRKAYAYSYAAFSPEGPYYDATLGVYIGGNFWDGRAYDTSVQAQGPPINPNEMNNTPVGTAPNQYPPLLVKKIQSRPYTPLFKQIYGQDVFTKYTPRQIFEIWGEAIAAFEASGEVCQFSSKYDASQYGVPPQNLYTLSASEERGRAVVLRHAPNASSATRRRASRASTLETEGKETFTMYCFANIGVPKNPGNPYYAMTDPVSNPTGYNPLGRKYIDWGLGDNATGGLDGTKFFNKTPGDILQFRGLFLTPTTRNVDLRPAPTFIKAYFHNGFAKSLQEVVHFYNTRNIAVNASRQAGRLRPPQRPAHGLHGDLAAARGARQRAERRRLHPRPGGRRGDHRGDGGERPGGQPRADRLPGGRPRQLPQDPQRRLHRAQPRPSAATEVSSRPQRRAAGTRSHRVPADRSRPLQEPSHIDPRNRRVNMFGIIRTSRGSPATRRHPDLDRIILFPRGETTGPDDLEVPTAGSPRAGRPPKGRRPRLRIFEPGSRGSRKADIGRAAASSAAKWTYVAHPSFDDPAAHDAILAPCPEPGDVEAPARTRPLAYRVSYLAGPATSRSCLASRRPICSAR